MSYLATLARPAQMPTQAAAEPPPASRAEAFGEVHEEVVAASRDPAPEPSDAPVVGPEVRAPVVMHDVEVFAAPSPAPVEPASNRPVPRDTSPRAQMQPARLTPVVAQQGAAADAKEVLESNIETTSVRDAPSPLVRRIGTAPPAVQVRSDLPAQALSPPAAPILRRPEHGPLRDEPAREPVQPLPRVPMTPSVRSEERADRPSVRGAPARTVRPGVNVHIGAISLTVKARAAAAPAVASTAQPLPAAAPPRSREGLGFSASRHYLRWS